MADTYHLAVDLGGTNIRAALFSEKEEKMIKREHVPTDAHLGAQPVLETMLQIIEQVMPEDRSRVRGVGVGVPGPVDPYRGVVVLLPNIPGWEDFPLQRQLEKSLGLPVRVANDANLAALGEWTLGAGQGTRNLLYLTISTGIGSGVICDGHMLLGENGFGAELGHLIVLPDGPVCGCGKKGHLEAVASGPSIARRAREKLAERIPSLLTEWNQGDTSKITSAQIAKAAEAGDPLSKAIFQEAGWYIGSAVANMLVVFNPSVIVFGGGVLNAGDLLMNPIRQSVEEQAMNPSYTKNLRLVRAMLGDDSGLYGGFSLSRGAGQ